MFFQLPVNHPVTQGHDGSLAKVLCRDDVLGGSFADGISWSRALPGGK